MTADRDVRLTPSQIYYLTNLTRKRIRELGKTIARAEANAAAGATIQHGTLQRHHEELGELGLVADALEVARKQIARQIADGLGVEFRG